MIADILSGSRIGQGYEPRDCWFRGSPVGVLSAEARRMHRQRSSRKSPYVRAPAEHGIWRPPIGLRNYAQRFQTRKVAVVSDECVGVDSKGGGGLHRIGQFETQRRTQPRRTLGDIGIEVDDLPRFQDGAIAAS